MGRDGLAIGGRQFPIDITPQQHFTLATTHPAVPPPPPAASQAPCAPGGFVSLPCLPAPAKLRQSPRRKDPASSGARAARDISRAIAGLAPAIHRVLRGQLPHPRGQFPSNGPRE